MALSFAVSTSPLHDQRLPWNVASLCMVPTGIPVLGKSDENVFIHIRVDVFDSSILGINQFPNLASFSWLAYSVNIL